MRATGKTDIAGISCEDLARSAYFLWLLPWPAVVVVSVTVALALADPPLPAQVIEYVDVAAGATFAEPEIPEAVNPAPLQEVVLVELQVSIADCPDEIDEGLAVIAAVGCAAGGGGGGGGVDPEPEPEHDCALVCVE
jgi:hypothetical protein